MKSARIKFSVQDLERWGSRYLERLAEKDEFQFVKVMRARERIRAIRVLTIISMLIAFLTGALTAFVAVYIDRLFADFPMWAYLTITATATIVTTIIELFLLGWLSVYSVYLIGRMTGLNLSKIREKAYLNEQMGAVLTRAALELPDPVHHFLGIDPLARVSKKKILIVGIIYKAKVFLTNVAARILLGKLVGSTIGKNISIFFVAVPITGIWDMVVIWRVYREANLRLFGSILAREVVDQIAIIHEVRPLSPLCAEGCVRAVANSVVLTQKNHPNMLLLLYHLYHSLHADTLSRPDSWELFLQILNKVRPSEKRLILDLLCISAAFDGHISGLEKKVLGEAFGEYAGIYNDRLFNIRSALTSGKLEHARRLCRLSMIPVTD